MRAIIDAEPGQPIYDFAVELIALAKRENIAVRGRHNENVLTAYPTSNPQEVLKPYNEKQKASYLGAMAWIEETANQQITDKPIRVQCKCGWIGNQNELASIPGGKSCPECDAIFHPFRNHEKA